MINTCYNTPMKITVSQKTFSQAIKAVGKTLNRKPHAPILSGILLQAQDNILQLTTTDLVAGVKVSLPAQIATSGSLVVSGKSLSEALACFDQDETILELGEKGLMLKNGRDRIIVPILTEDYPDFSLAIVQSQELSLDFWEKIVKKVAFASSSDQSRPALTGILIKPSDQQTEFVCTDGFRLSVLCNQSSFSPDVQNSLIVSAKALIDSVALAQIFDLDQLSFSYDFEHEQIIFFGPNFSYFSKIINSNFPPFEKIIPLDFDTEITLDRQDLVKNLNKAAIFARTSNNIVKFSLEDKIVHFSSSSLDSGSFSGEQEADSKKGPDLEISFNIRYLLDFLSTFNSSQVWFGFNQSSTPVMLKDLEDSSLQYIVMPFKPKG